MYIVISEHWFCIWFWPEPLECNLVPCPKRAVKQSLARSEWNIWFCHWVKHVILPLTQTLQTLTSMITPRFFFICWVSFFELQFSNALDEVAIDVSVGGLGTRVPQIFEKKHLGNKNSTLTRQESVKFARRPAIVQNSLPETYAFQCCFSKPITHKYTVQAKGASNDVGLQSAEPRSFVVPEWQCWRQPWVPAWWIRKFFLTIDSAWWQKTSINLVK